MPYIQLKTTKEQHKQIKLKAIESGKTIPEYVLECILTVDMSRCLDKAEKEIIENVVKESSKKPKPYKEVAEEVFTKVRKEFNCEKCKYPAKAVNHTCK